MCGIAGVVRLDGRSLGPPDRVALKRMAAAIAHRGPDDEQLVEDGPAGLAFKRLSIVDVAGGRQPLRSEDGAVLLIANGEIYNHESIKDRLSPRHTFRTRSDCEAILHLYEEEGPDCLRALVGMFGLAIWDRVRQRLYLARDRLGIKPLFYTANRQRVVFASEIKALFQYPDCPRALDWPAALQDPLLSGAESTNLSDPTSYFQGIEHLPAGCLLEVDVRAGTIERRRYWEFPSANGRLHGTPDTNEDELARSYGELLRDAVRSCLMSDVELGIFLSGGIDSAAVAALAAGAGAVCHTFTVLSQSTLANGDARAGHVVATELGLPNHQVAFRWDRLSVTPDDWKRLLWLCETPACGAEQLYKFHLHRYAKAVRPDLKVMLTGQGSDEFNGGYSSMLVSEGEEGWPSLLTVLAGMERGRLLRACPPGLLPWEAHFPRSPISPAFLSSCGRVPADEDLWHAYTATKYRDLQMYNCWHEDRTAAGNSIENRVPFLDHRLVEFVLNIPPQFHSRLFWDKRILRDAVRDLLSPEIRERPKGPFFYGPDERFTYRMMLRVLSGNDFALIEEAFSAGAAADIIDRDAITEGLEALADDPTPAAVEVVLRLVNMGLLDNMARRAGSTAVSRDTPPTLSSVTVADWETDHEAVEVSLGMRRARVGPDAILALPSNVYLVRREDAGADGAWYIVVNNRVQYSLSESDAGAWLRVLRQFDGRRTLGEALKAAAVSEGEIRKYLEEAIDFGVVLAPDAEGEPASDAAIAPIPSGGGQAAMATALPNNNPHAGEAPVDDEHAEPLE